MIISRFKTAAVIIATTVKIMRDQRITGALLFFSRGKAGKFVPAGRDLRPVSKRVDAIGGGKLSGCFSTQLWLHRLQRTVRPDAPIAAASTP